MDLLERGIGELGIGGGDREVGRIRRFLHELELWNPKLNLVKASGDDLIVRHILDSLAAVPVLRETPGIDIGDIGSGNGLPGILLAAWLCDRRFFLIERSGRRCAFLRNAAAVCRLQNVEVLQQPLGAVRGSFDVCVFRALGKLQPLAGDLCRAVRDGGVCIGYKGKHAVAEEEASELRSRGFEADVVPVRVPFLNEERCFIMFRHAAK